ncbi:FemAB family XrtA/PEP-CTERM system-associated protein [uncultured Erythrobacter sp.]|uniref:FemAB family XrtA/PEP-CTERM system-associated protein n=1 Tax=uncultured Erythrobacter sp. TaxID=263913 RepID=UPI00261A1CEE|nr:FemAB family XrtA/PEP-CTERM system-associated protein [uncultured Erythrobacter sp.]
MNAPIDMSRAVKVADLSDAETCARIEAYVCESKASLFHLPAWLKAVETATGHRASGLYAEQMGAITGWLPLTELRSGLFGKVMISSGFGVGGGIVADNVEAAEVLAECAAEQAGYGKFTHIELRGGYMPMDWRRWDDKHCGFVRDLAMDDEAELLAIPRKARAEVRKGLKNGLDVRVGRSDSDIAAHYAAYSESVRNLGTPVFPKSLFTAMLEAFPDSSDILTVSRYGKPLASVLSFYHNGAVLPFWGGGTFAARGARANELMYYELMLHARRRGMKRFDFGRSKTGSGPYNFKKNWGFTPEPLSYAEWTAPDAEPRDVDPTSAAYARKIALWKKLPLPIANLIGPAIARDLG